MTVNWMAHSMSQQPDLRKSEKPSETVQLILKSSAQRIYAQLSKLFNITKMELSNTVGGIIYMSLVMMMIIIMMMIYFTYSNI